MVSLTEQYRMAVPMFFPSLDLLVKWQLEFQVVKQRTWAGYMMRKSTSSLIPGLMDNVPDPNNDVDEAAIRYWLRFADYYQWPHMLYYDSVDDLVQKIIKTNLTEVSENMKQYNEEVRKKIKDTWSDILEKVLL